jgi:hypothetical protein
MYGLISQLTAGLDKCGVLVPMSQYDGTAITAYSATARAKGEPVYMVFGYTSGQEVVATDPATATYCIIGFAVDVVSAGSIGLYLIAGKHFPALVDDTATLSANDSLEVINGGTYLIDQGGTGHTVITVHAVLEEAVTAAEGGGSPVLKNVMVPPSFPYKTIAGS